MAGVIVRSTIAGDKSGVPRLALKVGRSVPDLANDASNIRESRKPPKL